MTPNRIVALITPVCALAAGWAASWLAEHVPGLDISQENLQAVFIAGAVTVLAPALHWLHGWQKWEVRNEEAIAAAAHGFPDQTPVVDDGGATEELLEDDDFEDLLDIDEFDDVDLEDAEEEPVAAGS
jgi:hypothetical protein